MNRPAILCTAGVLTILLSVAALLYLRQLSVRLRVSSGAPTLPCPPPCESIELSGILRRPSKATPRLELVPAGSVRFFEVTGPLLEGVPAGTPLRVVGVVRSGLYTGGTEENLSPVGPQWNVHLLVTEIEILKDPMSVLKRKLGEE